MIHEVPVSLSMILPPILLVNGFLILFMGLYRAPFTYVIAHLRQRRIQRPAVVKLYMPLPAIQHQHVLISALIGGSITTIIGTLLLQTTWVLLALPFLAFGCGTIALKVIEARQQRLLAQQLIAAAAEVAAAMNSDMTLNAALKRVAATLAHPLATPWQWMTDTAGASVIDANGATKFLQMKDTAHAVARQTTNRALLRFLEHIEGAADLPQPAARDRIQAASDALYASQLREQSVRTKLAHARGSGIMVVCIGLGIAIFLRSAMAEQWQQAFSGPWGLVASFFFLLVFMLPVVGIIILAQVPDVDF